VISRRAFIKGLAIGLTSLALPVGALSHTMARGKTRSPHTEPLSDGFNIVEGFNVHVSESAKLTKDNILDFIVECGKVLDEQDVPETARYVAVPEAWAERILYTEPKGKTWGFHDGHS
jgi:hypothetical protein